MFRLIPLACASFLGLLLFSIDARAQVIQVTQNQLVLTAQPGGRSPDVNLPISYTGGPTPYTLTFLPTSGGNWLVTSQANGTLPVVVAFHGNAVNLAPGIYTGTLRINVLGANNNPLDIAVTFNVGAGAGGTGPISANVSSLSFFTQAGGQTPAQQQVILSSSVGSSSFLASTFTTDGNPWLQVNPVSGVAPSVLTIGVNPAGLGAGTYTGSVSIGASTGAPLVISVTLSVSSNGALFISPSSLQFFYQFSGSTTQTQNVQFTTDGANPLGFTLTAATSSGGNWLFLSQTSGTTPQTVTVAANATGLPPGTYTGNIQVNSTGALTQTQNISVRMVVSNSTVLTLGPLPGPFNAQTGTATPAQTVSVASSSTPLNFAVSTSTANGTAWLTATPTSGTTPTTLTLTVNPLNLPPGQYAGTVTLTSPGAGNNPVSFSVIMNVNVNNGTTVLSALPSQLSFVYQPGGTNLVSAQSIGVTSSGFSVQVNVAASTSNCGNTWLQALTPATNTPANVTVTVSTNALPQVSQICNGIVQITSPNLGGGILVPVKVTVSTSALLNVVPSALAFTSQFQGIAAGPKTINISSTDGSIQNYSLLVSDGGLGWLSVSQSGSLAPSMLSVLANPGSLAPGTYSGTITVTSPALPAPQVVPVTLVVTPATTASVSPPSLAFTQILGGNTPLPQTISLNTPNGGYAYTLTTSTIGSFNWLSATPIGGTTPASISVAVGGNGLPAGNYTGSVTISVNGASNSPIVLPVTMTVVQSQGISSNPGSLKFNSQVGGQAPANQTVNIVTTAGAAPYTVSALTSGGGWLSVSPNAGTAPATLTVSVNPSGLAAGEYNGQVVVTSAGVLGSPVIVPVTLVVQPGSTPAILTVQNAAGGSQQAIAPGEIITILGVNIGPVTPVSFAPLNNAVGTLLGNTGVTIGLTPAPLLYVSSTQINAIVPYEVGSLQRAAVQVQSNGVASSTVTLPVAATSPAIFTANSSGKGQGSILNQDFSVNSASNPAAKGSIVQVFATGEGQTNPLNVTGSINGDLLKRTLASVTAAVDGIPAEVFYAGSAPSAIAGLFQVNVRIPLGASSGPVTIVITVGGNPTQTEVTVAVR